MDQRRYLTTLLLAAALGFPAAGAAVLLTAGLHGLEHLLWHDLPESAGWDQVPAWLVVLLPAFGGLLVAIGARMPGHGGHAALDGLSLDPVPWQHLPGVLLAAFGSISMGLVVGPEAPLVAIGLAVGLLAGQWLRRGQEELGILAFAGAFAALSTAFGGPLPSALLLFEVIAMGGKFGAQQIGRILLPGFLAAGTGALVFTGVGDWGGVGFFQLSLPGLPAYPTVEISDLLWAIPIAIASGAAAVVALIGGRAVASAAQSRSALVVLIGAGAAVGLVAVVARELADAPVEYVLFSGAAAAGPLLTEASTGVLAAVLVAKGLAFSLTIGAGFRGGLIFPTVTLGLVIGLLAHVGLGGPALTPAVVAGIAAAAAATLRAPFFGALIAALLAGSAAPDLAPVAIISAVLGWLVAEALERPTDGPAALEPTPEDAPDGQSPPPAGHPAVG